jgi:long-chain acyl-CoA synthetase
MQAPTTLPEMFLQSCDRWAAKPVHLSKKKGQYVAKSYADLRAQAFRLAAGMRELGLAAGDVAAIAAETSADWSAIDWAAQTLGVVTVPIFPTLTVETVQYILRDSGAKVAFVGDAKQLDKVEQAGGAILPVLMEGEAPMTLARMTAEGEGAGWSEDSWLRECATRKPEDLATIIYTSGTTGEPKGAELTHEAFVFQCVSIRMSLPIDHRDRFFSFLPISHVYERLAGHFLPVACGAETAYAESLKSLAHDLVLAQPTIIPAVPRFLESVRSKILGAMEHAAPLNRMLFNKTLTMGPYRCKNDLSAPGILGAFLDKLVGSKIRAKLGGRVRFVISGGAALPLDLAEFYAAFGIKVVQGYGLTETAPVISINHPERNQADSVGEFLEGLEVRIADDGEVLMRGPSRMRGYHNKPKETAEAIDSDGWFHTGDIGKLVGRRLWITDRKKDIIVMSNGKNVAPIMIENRLKASNYIEEAMVVGDDSDHIAALVVPNFEALRHYCHGVGFDTSHHQEALDHPNVVQLFKKEIETVNKGLADYEKVKAYRIVPDTWTQETGELTPSLKVKRPFVREKYASLLAEMK